MKRFYYQRAVEKGLADKGQQFPVQNRPARKIRKFVIPAGTPVAVRRLFGPRWQRHVTKTELAFERFEQRDSAAGRDFLGFRFQGYLIKVDRGLVKLRDVAIDAQQGGIRPWAQSNDE